MGVAVSPSSFHVDFAFFYLLKGKTSHSPLLQQSGIPPIGDSPPQISPTSMSPVHCHPPSSGLPQHKPPQRHGLLQDQAPAPVLSLLQAEVETLLCCWSFMVEPWAEGAAPCASPPASSLAWVSTWLFFSHPTPLQNKKSSQNKWTFPTVFPSYICYRRCTGWPSLG